jgi:predicted RNA-binding Zn-ribbon protein involved in translation (DUF1610 family)
MDDGETLPLSCPKCHHATSRTVPWVQENTFFTCPKCGNSVLIDKDAAMKALADLHRGAD